MSRLEHDYTPLVSQFNLPTLHSLQRYHDHLLMFKTLNGYILSPSVNNLFQHRQLAYNLRWHRTLHEDTVQSNHRFYSAVNRLKRQWNLLPTNLQSIQHLAQFKQNAIDCLFVNTKPQCIT